MCYLALKCFTAWLLYYVAVFCLLQQCFYSIVITAVFFTAVFLQQYIMWYYCITEVLHYCFIMWQWSTAVLYSSVLLHYNVYSIIFTAVFLQQKWYLVLILTPGSKNIEYILGLGVAAERVARILILHQVEKIYHISWYLVYCRNGI